MSKTTKALAILGVVAGLGVAAMPMSAMAAVNVDGDNETPATDELTVKTTIEDYISIELSGTGVTGSDHAHVLALGTSGVIANGATIAEGTVTVNVKTNNAKGYKLGIAAAGTSLVGETDTNTIPGGTPAQGSSFWGFKVAAGTNNSNLSVESDYSTYKAVPTDNTKISSGSKATTATGTDTDVTFGVTASADQAADTYSQKVTFTAAVDATTDFDA